MKFDVLCIGEVNIDMFLSLSDLQGKARIDSLHEFCIKPGFKIEVEETQIQLGGNAANVAVGLSRLGFKTALVSEIGDDELSLKVTNTLAKENVDRAFVKHDHKSPSTLSIILNVAGDRTIFTQHVTREHKFYYEYAIPSYMYVTSLGNKWQDAYKQALAFAQEKNVKIAFNPGTVQLEEGGTLVKEVIACSEILIVNKEEAETVLGIKNKELGINELLKRLQNLGAKIVVITDGRKGSYALDKDGKESKDTTHAGKVVERTGAGDSYATGFLAAIMGGKSVTEAMQWGSANATSVIGKIGAQPGLLTKKEMEEEIKSLENNGQNKNEEKSHITNFGDDKPLYLLECGNADTFAKELFGKNLVIDLTQKERKFISEFYQIMFDGLLHAVMHRVPKDQAAILVDKEFGGEVVAEAAAVGITTILSTPKRGQEELATNIKEINLTSFWGPLLAYYKGLATREEVVTAISREYQRLYEAFTHKPMGVKSTPQYSL